MFSDWFYLLPDWLNLIGSIIYLCSACMYPYQFNSIGDKTEWFTTVQLLEVCLCEAHTIPRALTTIIIHNIFCIVLHIMNS